MQNTKRISDLEDCRKALDEARSGKPVLISEEARDRFTLVSYQEYDKVSAALLEVCGQRGDRESARRSAWLAAVEVQDTVREQAQKTAARRAAQKR